jgi:hypothetical protein
MAGTCPRDLLTLCFKKLARGHNPRWATASIVNHRRPKKAREHVPQRTAYLVETTY